MVLAELDRLKHREKKASLKLNAIRAIDYIYDQMKSKNPRLQGNFTFLIKIVFVLITVSSYFYQNFCFHYLKKTTEEIKYCEPFHFISGQKATKDGDHIIEINSPDDRILNCCLQLKNQSKNVTLITNDKNLSIKAIFNGVHTVTAKKCLDIY